VKEDRSLELSGETLARLIDAAKERILRHLESLPRQPSADTEGAAALARSLVEPLPRAGRPYEELLDLLFDDVIPKSFNTAGPGYLAYIPGGGLYGEGTQAEGDFFQISNQVCLGLSESDVLEKLAKLKGEFVWHRHESEDELFLVIDGVLLIELENDTIRMKPGELVIIPRAA